MVYTFTRVVLALHYHYRPLISELHISHAQLEVPQDSKETFQVVPAHLLQLRAIVGTARTPTLYTMILATLSL